MNNNNNYKILENGGSLFVFCVQYIYRRDLVEYDGPKIRKKNVKNEKIFLLLSLSSNSSKLKKYSPVIKKI